MNRRYQWAILVILLLGLVCAACDDSVSSEAASTWQTTFGGPGNDYGECVQQTSDGGYIVSGFSYSYGQGMGDVWLVKLTPGGEQEWSRDFGGPEVEYGHCVQQTADGGYIVLGTTSSTGAGLSDIWLIKTDSHGVKVWDKTFGGSGYDAGGWVQQTSDGGYIVVGSNSDDGVEDVWLMKTDASGNETWSRTFGGAESDMGYSVQQTSDGGYVVGGWTASYGAGWWDAWLIKTDSTGAKQWDRTFGSSGSDGLYSVSQAPDGGYVACGHTSSSDRGTAAWVVKTNESGDEEWANVYDSPDWGGMGASIQQSTDGGYIVSGRWERRDSLTRQYPPADKDVLLVSIDASGQTRWTRTFGDIAIEEARCVQQTADGGYIVVVNIYYPGASITEGQSDVLLMKVDAEGNMTLAV